MLLSGMTSQHSEEQCCQEWTLSMQDSLANRSVLLALEKAWSRTRAGYFSMWRGLSEKHRRLLCFSKTSGLASESLSRWSEVRLNLLVINAGTVFFQQEIAAPDTEGSDGSYWPTLTANRSTYQQGGAKGRKGPKRYSLESLWRRGELPTRDSAGVSLRWTQERSGPQKPFGLDLLEGNDWDEYAAFFLRMDSGLSHRGHRIKSLGNTNPPIQFKTAFEKLMGLA
jgi:hypothetical protein